MAAPDAGRLRRRISTKVYTLGDVELRALNGVSLTVAQGEFVAIMGASGSGKSTLMNILGCLDRPTSGRYSSPAATSRTSPRTSSPRCATGRSASSSRASTCSRARARMENVELPLVYAGVAAQERASGRAPPLERVGLGDRLAPPPDAALRRTAAARRHRARDRQRPEASSSPTSRPATSTPRPATSVMALFQELWQAGLTVVFVTHEPDVARYASRVVVVRDGHILSDTRQEPAMPSRRRRPRPRERASTEAA